MSYYYDELRRNPHLDPLRPGFSKGEEKLEEIEYLINSAPPHHLFEATVSGCSVSDFLVERYLEKLLERHINTGELNFARKIAEKRRFILFG